MISACKVAFAKKSNTWRWALITVTIAAAVFVGVAVTQKDKRKNMGYEELMNQAIRYKSLGLYDKSLQAYMKATKLKEPSAESQMQMASVLISEDRQSLLGRRILERALVQEDVLVRKLSMRIWELRSPT